jgi:hypothetical protein
MRGYFFEALEKLHFGGLKIQDGMNDFSLLRTQTKSFWGFYPLNKPAISTLDYGDRIPHNQNFPAVLEAYWTTVLIQGMPRTIHRSPNFPKHEFFHSHNLNHTRLRSEVQAWPHFLGEPAVSALNHDARVLHGEGIFHDQELPLDFKAPRATGLDRHEPRSPVDPLQDLHEVLFLHFVPKWFLPLV